jgi:hypothetical protein
MQLAFGVLGLHARRPVMDVVMVELMGAVALRKKHAQGRQRRTFSAWICIVDAMRWRRTRCKQLCWKSWTAQVACARMAAASASKHAASALARRAMSVWRAVYTQACPLYPSQQVKALRLIQSTSHGHCTRAACVH